MRLSDPLPVFGRPHSPRWVWVWWPARRDTKPKTLFAIATSLATCLEHDKLGGHATAAASCAPRRCFRADGAATDFVALTHPTPSPQSIRPLLPLLFPTLLFPTLKPDPTEGAELFRVRERQLLSGGPGARSLEARVTFVAPLRVLFWKTCVQTCVVQRVDLSRADDEINVEFELVHSVRCCTLLFRGRVGVGVGVGVGGAVWWGKRGFANGMGQQSSRNRLAVRWREQWFGEDGEAARRWLLVVARLRSESNPDPPRYRHRT